MNYSTFEISTLWHWIERLFVYQADSPLMMGSIPFALLFIFFLAISCHLYPAQELFAHSHDDVCHLFQPFLCL